MVVIAPEQQAVALGGRQWRSRAACRNLDPLESRPFVAASLTPAQRAWALNFCHQCPVWRECREWAAGEERFQGIAGGRAWRLLGRARKSDQVGERYRAAGVASGAPRARAAGSTGAAA